MGSLADCAGTRPYGAKPKVGDPILTSGLFRLVWFRILNASARKVSRPPSPSQRTGNDRLKEASMIVEARAAKRIPARVAHHTDSRSGESRGDSSCSPPGRAGPVPDEKATAGLTRLARLMKTRSCWEMVVAKTLYGKPDRKAAICDATQSRVSHRRTLGPRAVGRSQSEIERQIVALIKVGIPAVHAAVKLPRECRDVHPRQ